MQNSKKYTCPVCGYKVFEQSPGSDAICPICFWQDDLIDLEKMYEPVGPNKVSLEQAQKNYKEFGASEKRFLQQVRPVKDEEKDPHWRMLDRNKDMPKEIDSTAEDTKNQFYWNWN